MLKRFSDGIIFTFAFTCSSILWAGAAYNYVVKKNDTLSKIAHKNIKGPIYSSRGSLWQLKKLNPQITNENLIFAGQVIALAPAPVETKRTISSETLPSNSTLPPPAPASTLPPPATNGFKPASHLGVDVGVGFFRIDSTEKANGARARLLSNLSPTLALNWEVDFTEHMTYGISISDQSFDIQQTLGGPSIAGGQGNAYAVAVTAKRNWTQKSQTAIHLGYQEKIFDHSHALNQVNIDLVAVPYLAISHQQELFSVSKASLGLGLEAIGYGRASGGGYSTDQGYGGKAYLFAEHELKNFSIRARAGYGAEKINSDLAEQTRSDLETSIGLVWKFEE